MNDRKLHSYLISGTIGYSLWKKNKQILLILHDNHSTESYCTKKSIWIAELMKSLDAKEWNIYVEEPDKEVLKNLKSLWSSKHVADVRALDKDNIFQSDIRYDDAMQSITKDTINKYVELAPLSYKNELFNIRQFLYNEQYKNTSTLHSTNDLIFPECISNWRSIFPLLSHSSRLACFKDFIFEGHLLHSIISSKKHTIIYAGSWHCRAIQDRIPTIDGWVLVAKSQLPLGHVLEKNCIEIIF